MVPVAVSAQQVALLRAQADKLWLSGAYSPAAIGRKRKVDTSVREDFISWVDPEASAGAVRSLLNGFEKLRLAINEHCYLGLFDFEAHFTRYAAGSHYARHLDRFNDGSERAVSCVLYLNEVWSEADGGQLRLYLEPDCLHHTDVVPRAGTLVTFLSDRFPHEVLPANRERWSFAGWFRKRSAGNSPI